MEEKTKCARLCGHKITTHQKTELAMANPEDKPTPVYECEIHGCDCKNF